jgi:tetratricopeptide (TPR) repeat protein
MTGMRYQGWDQDGPSPIATDVVVDHVATTLGVSAPKLASLLQAGLIRCVGTRSHLEIQIDDSSELGRLRSKKALRLRKSLDNLFGCQPTATATRRPVTLINRGRSLLLRLANGNLTDIESQLHFDFDSFCDHQPLGRIGPDATITAESWHERGIDQELRGQLEQAIASYTEALLASGPDPQIVFDLAYALAEAGHLDRAIERYRQVIELDRYRQDAWVNLGDLLMTDGHADSAIDAFRRAIDLDPEDAAARYNLADAYEATDQVQRATPQWEIFLRLSDPLTEHARYARSCLRRRLHPAN